MTWQFVMLAPYNYLTHNADSTRVRLYACSKCDAVHHVALGHEPIMPFCWQCREPLNRPTPAEKGGGQHER